jgi:hypothetical protein
MVLRKREDDLGNMSRGSILRLRTPERMSNQRTMTAEASSVLEMGATIDTLPLRPEWRLIR